MKPFTVFLLVVAILTVPASALNAQSIPSAEEMLDYFSGKKMSPVLLKKAGRIM